MTTYDRRETIGVLYALMERANAMQHDADTRQDDIDELWLLHRGILNSLRAEPAHMPY